ncbi:odorant receptor 131-2-like [Megalops cyprinoides]|uniref:odorant receptor 131-2-like n=1 Tax=Megalops cyprinoides TaxID=118141 RepID=UPI0018640F40|nr:odorant receptor 131-2-like [Megalops cyprinoides]
MANASTIFDIAAELDRLNSDMLKFSLSILPCLFFIYINCVMLVTLMKKAAFRGVSRYILFGHMLITDSIQLLWSMLSYVIAVVKVYMSNGTCAILLTVANITTRISPLNLAVMALERYSAICFPLRHAEIATNTRTGIAIGVIWVLGSLNALIEFFLFLSIGPPFAVTQVYCIRGKLFEIKLYLDINRVFTAVYLLSVGLIIIYTYAAIMVEARSVSSDKVKATKARNTVLLHFIQLGLCLTTFLIGVLNVLASRLEGRAVAEVKYVIFMVFVILPRCLSPLIYGLRDESFRPAFVYYFTFGLKKKIKPAVT